MSRHDVLTDPENHIAAAQLASSRLPEWLRTDAQKFRRSGSPTGGWLVTGLPLGDIPVTPDHADLAVGGTLRAAAVLALFGGLLGDQYGFKPELGGNAVQDITPVRGFETTQQSISSQTPLDPHTEMAFTDNRADFVGLLGLRQDHEQVAGTTLSPVERILDFLDPAIINVLSQPRFKTTVDGSFLRGSGRLDPIYIGPISILAGPAVRPRVRCDFAETTGLDLVAEHALGELRDAVLSTAVTVRLRPGDLLFVDNHYAFHGRTAFSPRWDGADRWLLRTFITRDLARLAVDRPDDRRVVDTDYSVGDNVFI